jgi:hypothetical protein
VPSSNTLFSQSKDDSLMAINGGINSI